MGRHHVRLLSRLLGPEAVLVVDVDRARAEDVALEHGASVADGIDGILNAVDVAVVAVPTVDHLEVSARLIEAGTHVLMEKPIAADLDQADAMIAAAAARGVVLAVGHVEFYNPAVQEVLALGLVPRFVEVERMSPFSPRSLDVDVVLDLMIHDLQILHALDPSPVREVRAVGIDVLSDRIDIADARIELESGCVANLTASRVSAERVRQLRVFFEDRYFSLDYQKQTVRGARRVRDEEEAAGGGSVSAGGPAGRILAADLEVEGGEPLRLELEAFLDRCAGGGAPFVDGAAGRRALETALLVNSTIAGSVRA
ncbi:MAG: Gfo/Idh/MocA family oxidoreductase [Holophagales bacterium]|nr:Gfo/Idh/MocA family oxidoreductase [Holophagales bacterium]MYD22069.1 Gfo/Idh/MocA family oxidoreductase [Holophagales bacterium]MYI32868.1 Gfo/Idh/MocA family oxidoreductase [Holophagales bacterium]